MNEISYENNGFGMKRKYSDEDDSSAESEVSEDFDEGIQFSQTDNPAPRHFRAVEGRPLKESKTIICKVHEQVKLDGLLVEFLDIPEFQRLGKIRQLGGSASVYPGASHTRKEHSIGVAHLAGEFVQHLRQIQPEYEINDDDELCVRLAGLLHDIGHGPYSHMFEEFMNDDVTKKRRNTEETEPEKWTHEIMSTKLLKLAIDRHQIPLIDYFESKDVEHHMNFVIKLITGLEDDEEWPLNIGRTDAKRFLFDIVSNSRNGIDVDKMDYLVRDQLSCFGKTTGAISRIIKCARILTREGKTTPEICYEQKIALDINEIYQLRATMHRKVYQHRVGHVVEKMYTDVLCAADETFKVRGPGPQGQPMRLSEAAFIPEAFCTLDDGIFGDINRSCYPGLEKARELLNRIDTRNFYSKVGGNVKIPTLPLCRGCSTETPISMKYCGKCGQKTEDNLEYIFNDKSNATNEKKARDKILELCVPELENPNDLFCSIINIQCGKKILVKDPWNSEKQKTYDPIANVGFFNPKEAGKIQVISIDRYDLPSEEDVRETQSKTLYCYLKNGKITDNIVEAFDKFKKEFRLEVSRGAGNVTQSPSPVLKRRRGMEAACTKRRGPLILPPTAEETGESEC
eukprot:CAMPEP_0185762242 /NCGR_PEP_ID=MMETSP1174-20130828/21219_1 /TAXON_ID=35687 /ORGANISM="Dictyocha speculum, Strain CCMP1381" /LENGTH=626 /DNA_ID=CAMNT_0028443833 /DNA_START=9 /DNA_END=1889 /DNA_ORIENTATION=+